MEKNIIIILASDEKNGIGKNGILPWRLKSDMAYFKEVTTTTLSEKKINALIMGRKTWESIPEKFRPLPWRKNIVLSRTEFTDEWCHHFFSLEEALANLEKDETIENIFIIGGAQIYNEVINKWLSNMIYQTKIRGNFLCDTFFVWVPSNYELTSIIWPEKENDISFQFEVYEKIREKSFLTKK